MNDLRMNSVDFSKKQWTIEGNFKDKSFSTVHCKCKSNADNNELITKFAYGEVNLDAEKNLMSLLTELFQIAKINAVPFSKGTVSVKLLDQSGEDEWTLVGAWPKSVTWFSSETDNPELLEVEITWKYDDCVYKQHKPKMCFCQNEIRPIRKFRWVVSFGMDEQVLLKETFVKCSRPTATVDEFNGKTYVKWNTFSFKICDIKPEDECEYKKLYDKKCNWLKLRLHDGFGTPLEEWTLEEATLETIQFECSDAEFHFAYKGAKYKPL